MNDAVKNIADYIKEKGISIKVVADRTGIPYRTLYDSLFNKTRKRELRASEFLSLCKFLDKDPKDFWDKRGTSYEGGYMNLKDVETCDLIEELAGRDGVAKTVAKPYEDKNINVNGPAIVLVVID